MKEYLNPEHTPGYTVFSVILEEAYYKFSNHTLNDQILELIADYIEERIQEEIYNGLFRATFITPTNRLAEYAGVRVRKDPYDPNRILVSSVWVYVDEEEDFQDYEYGDEDDFWERYWYYIK